MHRRLQLLAILEAGLMGFFFVQSIRFLIGMIYSRIAGASAVTALTMSGITIDAPIRIPDPALVNSEVTFLIYMLALPLITLVVAGFSTTLALTDQPVFELLSVYLTYLLGATNPIATAVLTEIALLEHNAVFVFTQTLTDGTTYPLVSPWVLYTGFYALVTIVLILLSVRSVRRIEA